MLTSFVKLSIIKKLIGLFLINIIILFIIAAIGYSFTKNNSISIENIKQNKLPIYTVQSQNLYLLENMMNKFSDAVITNEYEILQAIKKSKEILNNNFILLSKYNVDISEQQDFFDDYYKLSYVLTDAVITKSKELTLEDANLLQKYSSQVLASFQKAKDLASNNLDESFENISNDSKKYYQNSLIISLFGFVVVVFFGYLMFKFITTRFSKVIDSVKNLTDDKPNFSLRLKDTNNDEITVLINLFNKLSSKLEGENNNLQELVRIEVEKNKVQYEQLIKQSRLAQMGEMLSMIAHQWRQPLGAISSTNMIISLKATLDQLDKDEVLSLTEKIVKYIKHLNETIEDFRNFFKPNKEKVTTNYNILIKDVLNIIEPSLINAHIELVQELDCDDEFLSYPNEIKQVILNLIKNAEDILIDKKVEKPYIVLSTYKKDKQLILEVKDNGGGIDDEIIENIFDPYFSTKLDKNGTGLGLYMSKTIIDEHCNGSLNVDNYGAGARFCIVLNKYEDNI